MKRLLPILILIASGMTSLSASRIVADINVVGIPSPGDTFTVNASTRTWFSAVTNTATQILISTNSAAANATNLVRHAGISPFGAGIAVTFPTPTNLLVYGAVDGSLSISFSAAYATVSYTTNTVGTASVIRVPFSVEAAATRTNNATQLVSDLESHSANAFSTGTTLMSGFVDTSTAQVISGPKTLLSVTTSNLVNIGSAISSAGSGSGSLQIGVAANAAGADSLSIGDNSEATGANSTSIGASASDNGFANAVVIGTSAQALSDGAIVIGASTAGSGVSSIGIGSGPSADYAIAIGAGAIAAGTNSIAIGLGATAASDNAITIGTAANRTTFGGVVTGSVITNSTYHGTIGTLSNGTVSGATVTNSTVSNSSSAGTLTVNSQLLATMNTINTLDNVDNIGVSVGNFAFIKLTAGPTGAFAIAGIAGGAAGRILHVYNATGQNLTWRHESGSDPVAGNRIICLTGSDVAGTGNSGATLIYDAVASRWILLHHSP